MGLTQRVRAFFKSPTVGITGTCLAMSWDAFWLVGPPLGIATQVDRQQYFGWGFAALCICLLQALWSLKRRERELSKQLSDYIATRPKLCLREGAVHMDDVSFSNQLTGEVLFTAQFIHVRFMNEPIVSSATAVAKNVGAKVQFSSGGQVIKEIDGRWADSDQPGMLIAQAKSTLPLLRIDFDIASEHNVDLVFKAEHEANAYIFNNDSYHFLPTFRKPDFALGPGVYDVAIRLRGVDVDEVFRFSFQNPGAGHRLTIMP